MRKLAKLSAREQEVLQGVVEGKSNKEVARELKLKESGRICVV